VSEPQTPTVRRELVLDASPTGFGPYLRAVLPRSGARPATVPEVVLRLDGVRPSAGDVARYAAVVGEPGGDRLPLLYPHLLGFGLQLRLMGDASFPVPALGLVHVTNEVTATRPLRLGAELGVAVRADAIRPHPRGRVVDLVTEVREGGELVWREVSSYLSREKSHGSAERAPGEGSSGSAERGPKSLREAGALHQSAVWRLPADLGRSYAGVSGDVNPIHLSALTARPLGFPRAIAHGMWTAAAVLGALAGRVPDAVRFGVQFRRPILLPSTVRLFTALDGDRIEAEVRGKAGDDRLHLAGSLRPL
jgi:acyl dehydratase